MKIVFMSIITKRRNTLNNIITIKETPKSYKFYDDDQWYVEIAKSEIGGYSIELDLQI